jgi:hypothetical protein
LPKPEPPKAAAVEPPPEENRTEKPLLATSFELPILARPPPVVLVEVPEAVPKKEAPRKPEADEGAFWSDGDDDEDEAPPIKIQLPDDDDDDEVLKPNPLVMGRARKVDLTTSIRLQAEALKNQPSPVDEPPPMPPALDAEERAAVAVPPAPAQASVEDDYGELADAPRQSEPAEKRTAKVRAARFRTRGTVQAEADE